MSHNIQGVSLARLSLRKLKIMQVNVGRGDVANDLALQHAFGNQCNFLLVQEPWIGTNLDRQLSKRHNAYQAYAPKEVLTDRPRVIIYA